ncbi:hypothetical protein AV545_04255 [Paenibacillus jamilae]|uniref:hypothetical protein n=1 Tax=Paenibacillus jamilae TaxID=114136 RepID=UPI0007ABE06A|nr:hypothetical protein [Paenibacillus jamilae]KZE65143.1 hypothetical protein AV545_04255 [Paenibacillus jamilae]
MNKLTGCKAFGNWGGAGWDYGIVVNEFSDSIGTDIVIEWEDGRQQTVDIKDIVEINDDTDIETVGIYIDVKGEYLSSNINVQITKEEDRPSKESTNQTDINKFNCSPRITNYDLLDDLDKLRALSSCLVEAILSLNARTYGYNSLLLSEQQRVKNIFFEELNKNNIEITTAIISKAKRLTWNTLASLLYEYIENKQTC